MDLLPEEVLEFILGFLPPYKDLENCLLVNKKWYRCAKGVMRKTRTNLHKAINDFDITWQSITPMEMAPTISKRYSHSAVIHENSMFVFGGCTCTSTTFNDLWRLDLSKRQWVRPLTMGTHPSPKACASIVCYGDCLYLFGGWTHPSPYPLHQTWKLFNELHIYNITQNRWSSLNPAASPPRMAGHSASVHGNMMVVFGGLQKHYLDYNSQFGSSNDIWCFNIDDQLWHTQETRNKKPSSRYGQSQIVLDDNHIMILGGCGGPNMIYSDCWLLTISEPIWTWREIKIKNKEYGPVNMWCNQACKVGDMVVILGQIKPNLSNPSYSAKWNIPNRVRPNMNIGVPAREPSSANNNEANDGPQRLQNNDLKARFVDVDLNVNGKWGSFVRKPINGNVAQNEPTTSGVKTLTKNENDLNISRPGSSRESENQPTSNSPNSIKKLVYSNTPNSKINEPRRFNEQNLQEPSLNMMAFNPPSSSNENIIQSERVRRLNAVTQRLRQYEESYQRAQRLKDLENDEKDPTPSPKKQKRNQLGMFVLDISKVLTDDCTATWMCSDCASLPSEAPEETILYSLVAGKGELIMFGGIRKDANCLNSSTNVTEQVSHSLHFIMAPKEII